MSITADYIQISLYFYLAKNNMEGIRHRTTNNDVFFSTEYLNRVKITPVVVFCRSNPKFWHPRRNRIYTPF